MDNYKEQLEDLKGESDLTDYVIDYVLDNMDNYYGDDKEKINSFFKDLFYGGCQSGFIGSLIYYKDTHAFYDKFYDEIETLREDYEQEVGEPLKVNGDLKNFYAWFGFEETARKVANEIGLY